jgi:glyoxylase-like metal-dependent hydrolase (beta-lactamase superfamily II)
MEKICINLSVTNCYLLPTLQHKYVLIDTGYAEDWNLFSKRLKQTGIGLDKISHIILTHHHDDHCGLLNPIIQANPDIQVVMSALAKDLLLVGKNDRTHGGGIINRNVEKILAFKQTYLSWVLKRDIKKENNLLFPIYHLREKDILIKEDQSLEKIGIHLPGKIIATPGHSTDSISILFDDGDCFIGDAAANFMQFAGTNYCVIFVQDLETYYQSWSKVIAEKAQIIYPAHGGAFRVERLIENLGKNKTGDLVRR